MAARNVTSPIAGVVSALEKRPGDAVAANEPVVIVECMKVEIPIVSPVAGRVARLAVKAGDAIAEHQVVFVVES
jgi:acetyl-CoA carboxylase biotin carboxyl carrier protein